MRDPAKPVPPPSRAPITGVAVKRARAEESNGRHPEAAPQISETLKRVGREGGLPTTADHGACPCTELAKAQPYQIMKKSRAQAGRAAATFQRNTCQMHQLRPTLLSLESRRRQNVAGAGAERTYRLATVRECAGWQPGETEQGEGADGMARRYAGAGETDCRSIRRTGEPSAPRRFGTGAWRATQQGRAVPRSNKPLASMSAMSQRHTVRDGEADRNGGDAASELKRESGMVEIVPTTSASDLGILLTDAGFTPPRLSGPSGLPSDLRPPGQGREHNPGGARPAQYAENSLHDCTRWREAKF
ncbi:hypothetical protein THAOC_15878 [Thalassiosira oceanica]|uniref:Uncharacterized protein n=1 Tax=Thalassiosira oceanica TaxID=159749 RepID=K0SBD2_THAOC|nr:hypothetical protein THAOC_15878 [Thalassiosira oceanica]|eukprot:EJK63453.1 hypothetical protein THAOC_15878 [Thalassiosira oceanica]